MCAHIGLLSARQAVAKYHSTPEAPLTEDVGSGSCDVTCTSVTCYRMLSSLLDVLEHLNFALLSWEMQDRIFLRRYLIILLILA